jgi:hypothetical protein
MDELMQTPNIAEIWNSEMIENSMMEKIKQGK